MGRDPHQFSLFALALVCASLVVGIVMIAEVATSRLPQVRLGELDGLVNTACALANCFAP